MKLQPQIDALSGLAEIDAVLLEVEEELRQEREAIEGKRAEAKALEATIGAATTSLDDMEKVRSELMSDARNMSVQMDRSREKLGRSRTEREVNAAQREIEELRKLYRDREQEIDKIGGLADQARQDLSDTQQKRESLVGEIGSSAGAVAGRLSELETKVAEQRAKRQQFISQLPATLYRRYELVRKRRGSGVAGSGDGKCAACHIMLAPMQFQKLMRGEEFDQCPSCNRIIYYVEPAPASAEESSDSTGTESPAEG